MSLSARGVSRQRSLLARGVSCREESPHREEGGRHNNQNVREVRGEEEDGCGGSRDGGSREESLAGGVSLVARSLSRREESLSSRGSCLLRGVSHCEESLSSRGVSREESLVARSLS